VPVHFIDIFFNFLRCFLRGPNSSFLHDQRHICGGTHDALTRQQNVFSVFSSHVIDVEFPDFSSSIGYKFQIVACRNIAFKDIEQLLCISFAIPSHVFYYNVFCFLVCLSVHYLNGIGDIGKQWLN